MYKIPANTLFLGKNLIFMPECHSTNDLALKLCQRGEVSEGTLVITQHQIAGKGQRGNAWETEPGMNLTFSLIVKPSFLNVSDQFYLSMITSLGVHDFLSRKSLPAEVRIKWPNDVMVNEKKICGILIENQLQGIQLQTSVLGIGLNINQQHFNHPTATSLSQLDQCTHDLQTELENLLSCLEARYLQLRQANMELIKMDYLSSLYWRLEKHWFTSQGNDFEGTILGIDTAGRLQVEVEGNLQIFDLKEIAYLR
ncbi:MAG: biotin--[acetyl-CoA-carboxylase] ligase [Cyclobacteriaceae bacterium]|nr:biotin--[acetyl-CoA-carboxylase] ligase [Cyclobacteriaceae bacterium]